MASNAQQTNAALDNTGLNTSQQPLPAQAAPSTLPASGATDDADGAAAVGNPSFKEQVVGYAKKFGGQAHGRPHEVAVGEALLRGEGKDAALAKGEEVKQQQAQ